MNYTINYPTSAGTQHTHVGSASQTGQRAIILSPPGQSCPPNGSQNNNNNNCNNTSSQSPYPVVMQVAGSNAPVFYTYQNSDGLPNAGNQSKSNETTTCATNGLGQVVLSPVSPVQTGINIHQNRGSPTVSIRSENKSGVVRPLNELFSMQGLSGIQNSAGIVQSVQLSSNVPVALQNTHIPCGQQNTELANLISSIQSAGLQVIDAPNGNNLLNVPAISTNVQSPKMNIDKGAVANFIKALQASGHQVIENNAEKTLSISLPNCSVEDKGYMMDQVYKIVDGPGNVTMFTSTSDPTDKRNNSVPVPVSVPVTPVIAPPASESERYVRT